MILLRRNVSLIFHFPLYRQLLHNTKRKHGSTTAVKERHCSGKSEVWLVQLHIGGTYFSLMTRKALPRQQRCKRQQLGWVTYICIGPLICPWAGERDKFMASLVDHKTANCGRWGERERKERKGYVKIQCFIINGYTGSRKTWSSDNTKRNWRKTDVWARLPIMCPDGQSCLQADCSYWTVQCHLLTDMTGAKADTTYTNSHSILCTWSTPKTNRFTGWQNCLTCIHRIHIQTHTLECICLHAVRVTLSV